MAQNIPHSTILRVIKSNAIPPDGNKKYYFLVFKSPIGYNDFRRITFQESEHTMDNIRTGLPSDYVSLVSFFIRDEDEETALLRPGDTLFIYCRTGVVSVSDNGIVHSLTPGWFLLSHPRGSVQLRMSGIHSECCVLEIASGRTGIASCSASIFNFQAFDTLTRLDTEENRILLTLNEIANEISSHNEAEKRIMDLLFNVFLVKRVWFY